MTSTRRDFLAHAAAAVAGGVGVLTFAGCASAPGRRRPAAGEKLNLAVVGIRGHGANNLKAVQGENIVALCDVEQKHLDKVVPGFEGARGYRDYRDMLASEPSLDAVVVSTADHTHGVIAAAALRRGLDVYCEKPLAHTVHEVRVLTELASKHGAVTQMGTQIHAWENYRRMVEHIESGVIGTVAEVHVFCNKTWSGGERPKQGMPVPAGLEWDVWLGPAPARPYHKAYLPASWRRWWDFGGGTLGDMACHYIDLAYWALDLEYPETVQATGPRVHAETTPASMKVQYRFPARGDLPPVNLTWYDGKTPVPVLADLGLAKWKNGVLFVGSEGWLVGDYTKMAVGPAKKFAGYTKPKPYIPKSVGHHKEWLDACRTRGKTTCPFSYSGPLSEAVLLGNVSFRLGGNRLEWDPVELRAVNAPEAAGFIHKRFRDGWTL
jgi:predicted dehydrogenase